MATSKNPVPTQQYRSPIGPQPMSTVNNPTSSATTGKKSGEYLVEGKKIFYGRGGGGGSSPQPQSSISNVTPIIQNGNVVTEEQAKPKPVVQLPSAKPQAVNTTAETGALVNKARLQYQSELARAKTNDERQGALTRYVQVRDYYLSQGKPRVTEEPGRTITTRTDTSSAYANVEYKQSKADFPVNQPTTPDQASKDYFNEINIYNQKNRFTNIIFNDRVNSQNKRTIQVLSKGIELANQANTKLDKLGARVGEYVPLGVKSTLLFGEEKVFTPALDKIQTFFSQPLAFNQQYSKDITNYQKDIDLQKFNKIIQVNKNIERVENLGKTITFILPTSIKDDVSRGKILRTTTDVSSFFIPVLGQIRSSSFVSGTAGKFLSGKETSILEKVTSTAISFPTISKISSFSYGKTIGSITERFTGAKPVNTFVESTSLAGNVRQRATILLTDTKSRTLFQLDKPTGYNILPGGGIDKGESALKAAQRELFEETGLKIKLKKFDVVKTEREKNYIFKAQVNDLSKLKLKPQAKEVLGFSFIKPKDYSGKIASRPFGEKNFRLNPFSKPVRSEDLYIASRAKFIEEYNKKYASKVFSRNYNQTAKEAFLNANKMQYKTLEIYKPQEQFYRRGGLINLKQRVKPFSYKSFSSYIDFIKGRKPGQFKSFQRNPGIIIGFGSRYNVPFSKLKPYSKKDLFFVSGSTSPPVLMKGSSFRVDVKKNLRGEGVFYFQPPTTKEGRQAYLGLSYTGLLNKKAKSYETGITFKKLKPTIYLYKGRAGRELIFTKKAQAGKEFEVGAPAGTVFRVKSKLPSPYLANKRVRVRELELVKTKPGELTNTQIKETLNKFSGLTNKDKSLFVTKVKSQTGIDISEYLNRRYVDPYYLSGRVASNVKTFNIENTKKNNLSEERQLSFKKSPYKPIAQNYKRPLITQFYKSPSLTPPYKPASVSDPIRVPGKTPPSYDDYNQPRYKYPGIPTRNPPSPPAYGYPIIPKNPRVPGKRKFLFNLKPLTIEKGRFETGYKTYVKRFGKFFELRGISSKGGALQKLSRSLLTSPSRSGYVQAVNSKVRVNKSAFTPSNNLFRDYLIKSKTRRPTPRSNYYVQRKGISSSFESKVLRGLKRFR